MLIGDRALAFEPSPRWEYRYDLGDLWHRHTGLPFVFAAWIACGNLQRKSGGRKPPDENSRASQRRWRHSRGAYAPRSCAAVLNAARDKGVAGAEQIIQSKQPDELPISPERMLDYFRYNIRYRLGQAEQDGMNEFFDRAFALGLIPERRLLRVIGAQERGA